MYNLTHLLECLMARDSVKDTKKEIKKQNDEFYGEETVGGSQAGLDTDNDASTAIKKISGSASKKIKGHKGFVIDDNQEN